jgi:inhibitor of KinA
MKLEPLGDSAVVATLGSGIDAKTVTAVQRWSETIMAAKGRGVVDVVPAYATFTVFYDPAQFAPQAGDAFAQVCRFVESCASNVKRHARATSPKTLEIPVCYGGEFGPDIDEVAERAGMTAIQVAALHARGDYQVHAIGFTPGFPYLGGLPAALNTPRRSAPRSRVPAGSVGIGGGQTGVYPVASPGGWQLIGRTPLRLFQPDRNPAALLRNGDRVKFKAISMSEFETWK